MNIKKSTVIFVTIGVLLVTSYVFLMTATPVKAQCGSQASSCKNCHETQAQDPVNNDGTAWHSEHAFGDFCHLCHAGNNQSTDKIASHTGMVAPLSDIDASCKSCHPDNTAMLAQIYATTLGQEIGSGGSPAEATSQTTSPGSSKPTEIAPLMVVPASDMVDYSQRYDEVVLGKKPANVGNIILIALMAVIVFAGGFFVLKREGLINVSFEDPKRIPVQKKYPLDVLEILPEISRLKPASRRILQKILAKPQATEDLLNSIDRLTQIEPAGDQEPRDQQD